MNRSSVMPIMNRETSDREEINTQGILPAAREIGTSSIRYLTLKLGTDVVSEGSPRNKLTLHVITTSMHEPPSSWYPECTLSREHRHDPNLPDTPMRSPYTSHANLLEASSRLELFSRGLPSTGVGVSSCEPWLCH